MCGSPGTIQIINTMFIIAICILILVELILIIRGIYIKKYYTGRVKAKVIGKYSDGGSSYNHLDYQSSYAKLSKVEGYYYELEYTIDGVDYKSILQGLSIHTKKGDIIEVKYHKDDHSKITDSGFNIELFILIGLFALALILSCIFIPTLLPC